MSFKPNDAWEEKAYAEMLNNDAFLNDVFTSLDATTKIQILGETVDLKQKYLDYLDGKF